MIDEIDPLMNFVSWKRMAGLPSEFPKLIEVSNEEFAQRTYIKDQDKIDEILLRLNNQVICVTIKKGHGVTTIYRHMYGLVKENCLMRRMIPIEIDLESFWNGDYSDDIVANIKKGILTELIVSESWNMVLSDAAYIDIIGGFEAKDKDGHKNKIFISLMEDDWEEVERLCPMFAENIDVLIKQLSEKHQIKIVLFFDIPGDATPESFEYLANRVKGMYQEHKELTGLSEIYFMTPEHLEKMQRTYPRPVTKIDYNSKGYYFGHLVKILSLRYRPISYKAIAEIEDPLLIVFEQKFAEMAWSEERTLQEITKEMERLILERLTCENRDIPYKLEPTKYQIEIWEDNKNVR